MSRLAAFAVAMLATLGSAIAGEPRPGALTITFIHPETYRDASKSYGYGSDAQVLDAIRVHLQKLAARELPAGYSLSIEMYGYSDPLRYEKAMLDDWFERAITRQVHG